MSRATSYAGDPGSRSNSYGVGPFPPLSSPAEKRSAASVKRGSPRSSRQTPAESANVVELQQSIQKL